MIMLEPWKQVLRNWLHQILKNELVRFCDCLKVEIRNNYSFECSPILLCACSLSVWVAWTLEPCCQGTPPCRPCQLMLDSFCSSVCSSLNGKNGEYVIQLCKWFRVNGRQPLVLNVDWIEIGFFPAASASSLKNQVTKQQRCVMVWSNHTACRIPQFSLLIST